MVVDNNDNGENEWGDFVDFNTKTDKDISKPLPLFLFGDEELDDGGGGGDNLLLNDFEKVKSSSGTGTGTGTGTLAGVEFNDFIAILYKQAEKKKDSQKEAQEDSSKGNLRSSMITRFKTMETWSQVIPGNSKMSSISIPILMLMVIMASNKVVMGTMTKNCYSHCTNPDLILILNWLASTVFNKMKTQ